MHKLTHEQCQVIASALYHFERDFRTHIGYTTPLDGIELSGSAADVLLDRLDRLAMALDAAIPDHKQEG